MTRVLNLFCIFGQIVPISNSTLIEILPVSGANPPPTTETFASAVPELNVIVSPISAFKTAGKKENPLIVIKSLKVPYKATDKKHLLNFHQEHLHL